MSLTAVALFSSRYIVLSIRMLVLLSAGNYGLMAPLALASQNAPSIVVNGDSAHGIPACSSCHGAAGEGNAAAGFPRLAGLPAAYLERQLALLANGQRTNAMMSPVAKMLSADQRQALAMYYAQLPIPNSVPDVRPPPTAADENLARHGRMTEQLPGCSQCHGEKGVGVGDTFPPLAGQSSVYITNQLHAWQQHTRSPGPLGLMGSVAGKLSETDIKALAHYFAAQPADEESGP